MRHVIDTVYTTTGFCKDGPPCQLLTLEQAAEISNFAQKELIIPDRWWVRALSPLDSLHYVSRPDHTTGAYDAWPALLFNTISALDGSFVNSLPFLTATSVVTREGPYGQAHEIGSNGLPYKTTNGWTR